jgi:hypothetical protein
MKTRMSQKTNLVPSWTSYGKADSRLGRCPGNAGKTFMSRNKLKNLIRVVRVLKEKRAIGNSTYYDYMSLILSAGTPDQLDQVTNDLAEIHHSCGRFEEKKLPERGEPTAWLCSFILGTKEEDPTDSGRLPQEPGGSLSKGMFVDLWV